MSRTLSVCRFLVLAVAATLAAGCSKSDSGGEDVSPASIEASKPGEPVRRFTPYDPLREPHPKVQIKTSLGLITVELDGERAPLTVGNFIGYVNAGHYDGTLFHQVEEGFIAAGGGYAADLAPRVGEPTIRNEADRSGKNQRGTIAMVRDPEGIDSAVSQFFFNLADNESLDHKGRAPEEYGYCVFGRVTEGMDILDKLSKTPVRRQGTFENLPATAVVIESIRRAQ